MSARRPVPRFRSRRGAVLIVAMLIAAIIAVVLGSYLNLNLNSTRQAYRSFQTYAAINLGEAGAEEALWSFNRDVGGHADAWTGWSANGTAAWRKFDNFDFTQNTTGWVKVYVSIAHPSTHDRPRVVTLASVNPANGGAVTRMMELTLRQRAYFANGLVAKDSITFSGSNASVDSWDSDPDHDDTTAPVDYDPAIRQDGGTVASTSVANSAVLVNQANIWGYAFTGGAQPQVGTNGTVRGADTAAGVAVDPSRVATDFNAEFPQVAAPDDGTFLALVPPVLGVAGTATRWRATSISLSGRDTLTILGQVTLTLTAPSGSSALSVTGNASLIIPAGSSLTLYTAGDIKIAGNGLANANVQPISCQLWGTNTSPAGQAVDLAGNGALRAVVYAPAGDVKLNGNGDMMGSVVARTIVLVGNAAFHYDESLSRFGDNAGFGVDKWRELTTPAERATWESKFSGW